MALYFKIFWLPALVSPVLLVWLWSHHSLSDRSALGRLAWFVLALVLQGWVNVTGAWVAGLVLQTVLAVTLLMQWQLEGM